MSRPRVLVTGGAGFIGSFTAERFAREDWDVRVLDDLSSGCQENCADHWDLRVGDIRDPAAVTDAVAGCNVVVHLAAFTSVPESFAQHDACYRTNVGGTFHLLEACAAADTGKLIFASSSAVYAELPDRPKRESDCPEPVSPYAVSKLEGEHLCAAFGQRSGLSSVCLRFFNVFGPRQPADSDYAAVIPIFAERGLRGEPLTIYGDGAQTRDFVYVEDVAEAIFQAATRPAEGVLNIGTGVEIDVRTLADTIADLTGGPKSHAFAEARPGDIRSSTADVESAAEALEWRARFSLQAGLAETLAWWQLREGRTATPA